MLYFVTFKAEHLFEIPPQPSWVWTLEQMDLDGARTLEGRFSQTLMKDGKPIVACGVVEYWQDRGYMWSFIGLGAERIAHRKAREYLDSVPLRRLEAAVDAEFDTGCRWLDRLGFRRESAAPVRAFWPNGRDAHLYALVR